MIELDRHPGAAPALSVVRRLIDRGHRTLIAGGAVRDILLGAEPADYDVATAARPEEVREIFRRVVPVGERFGVVQVMVGTTPVQVATFRRDAVLSDGRRPVSVDLGTSPEEDALRRDFTVNALFLDTRTGEVLDYVGGRKDLGAGVIRAIGDPERRFVEDRLRMLRAIRFACGLGFTVEEETLRAVRAMAAEITEVSGERIRDELYGILRSPRPKEGLDLLHETGLLRAALPEVADMVGVPQPPEFHPEGDVFTHTGLVLENLDDPSLVLAFAALLHDVGKPGTISVAERIRFDGHAAAGAEMSRQICRRLRLSRRETEAVAELVRSHLRFMEVRNMRESRLRRFLTGPLAEEHLALHRADCLGSHRKLDNYEFSMARRAQYLSEPEPPPRLVGGRDLIDLGLSPGPIFAQLLGEVEDLQLEGRLRTREEALTFLRSRLGGEGDADA